MWPLAWASARRRFRAPRRVDGCRPRSSRQAYAASLADAHEDARLITTGEAARLLGISQPTLNRAVRRGRLRPARTTPGGHRRFDSAALSAALLVDEAHQ